MYPLWYQALAHRIFYPVTTTGMVALFSVRTWGYRNVPTSGGLLVVANHQSFLDPVLVGMAVRRRMVYLARKTLFVNPLFSWLIQSFGAIAIDQEKPSTEGIRTALELLKQQEGVVIFPEGERTPHGQMQELKPGVTLLVRRGQVPVLPVGIAGAYEIWPRHVALPHLCPIWSRRACCGRPLHISQRSVAPGQAGSGRAEPNEAPLPRPSGLPVAHEQPILSNAAARANPRRRGIAVVVGKPILAAELKALSHEAILARLTEALHQVWREAEQRRLQCA